MTSSLRLLGRVALVHLRAAVALLPLVVVEPCAEQAVEVDQRHTVVALELGVMQPVECRIASWISDAVVSTNRREVGVELGVEEVHRMAGEEQREERASVIQQMLDGMHRKTSPRSRVVALVVQRVNPAVHKRTNVTLCQAVLSVPPHSVRQQRMAALTRDA